MAKALATARPFLLLSLFCGISYITVVYNLFQPDGIQNMMWKGAGVALLALYAIRRLGFAAAWPIASVMAFGAMGDALIEIELTWGAISFFIGHVIAVIYYARNRRGKLTFSQKILAILVVPLTIYISWLLPTDRADATGFAFYGMSVAIMAAMAWTSSFPRYRVGIGAMMFVISDLFIFAELGPLSDNFIPNLLIWPLYYFGQFLICTGVVQTLYARKHAA